MKFLPLFILLLSLVFSASVLADEKLRDSARQAVELLEHSGKVWRSKTQCASCHHQTLPLIAGSLSQKAGVSINKPLQTEQLEFVLQNLRNNRGTLLRRGWDYLRNPDPAYMYSFLLWGVVEVSGQNSQLIRDIADTIGTYQESDGSWVSHLDRPPLEGNTFMATALALRVLTTLGIQPEKCALATRWLLEQDPRENEDRAFQLLGLFWSLDRSPKVTEQLQRLAKELAEAQRPDGGWSQQKDMESDAYATGQALFALATTSSLHEFKTTHPSYTRGLDYLLKTRFEDGSWQVVSRSKPIQKRFATGFPHGANQYISTAATAWAVMAISLALGQK